MNSKCPSRSRLWDSESRLIVPARLLQPQPPAGASLRMVFMWIRPWAQHLRVQAGPVRRCQRRAGLFPIALCITHVEGSPALPACPQPMQWLHCKAWEPGPRASPSLWCDLSKSPSLPCLTPHLELRGWAVMWKAPASSTICYFRIPRPLLFSFLHCWSP